MYLLLFSPIISFMESRDMPMFNMFKGKKWWILPEVVGIVEGLVGPEVDVLVPGNESISWFDVNIISIRLCDQGKYIQSNVKHTYTYIIFIGTPSRRTNNGQGGSHRS